MAIKKGLLGTLANVFGKKNSTLSEIGMSEHLDEEVENSEKLKNIRWDLSEEGEAELLNKYQALCDGITHILKEMYSGLREVAVNTRWELVCEFVNSTIARLSEETYRVSNENLKGWIIGTESISAMVEQADCGEGVIERAKEIENKLKVCFEQFWGQELFKKRIAICTECPIAEKGTLNEVKEIYRVAIVKVKNLEEEYIKIFERNSKENNVYRCMETAVYAITRPIRSTIEQLSDKWELKMHELSKIHTRSVVCGTSNHCEMDDLYTTKTIGQTDIKYNICTFGAKFHIGFGVPVVININGKSYSCKMHNSVKGRIDGMKKIYDDNNIQLGDELKASYSAVDQVITLELV